jgi:MFS family permease
MVFAQASIGFFGDRVNKRLLIVACMIGHTIALLFLTFAKSAGMVVVFAVIHGLSWGFRGPLMTSIRADYFGRGSFATIMGWSSLIIQIGTTTGPLIGAGIGDTVGTYSPAFGVFAGFTLLGAFFFAAAKPPKLTQNVSILQ